MLGLAWHAPARGDEEREPARDPDEVERTGRWPRLLPRLVVWGGPHVRLHVGSITSVVAPYADILCEERSDGTEHEQQREVAFIAFSF